MKCLWHIPLQVKRSKVKQSHRGYSKFCRVHSIFQVKRSKVRVTQVIWSFYRVRSVASSFSDRITSYVAYIQHMTGQCAVPHFQDERSTAKVTRVVSIFGAIRSVVSSLFDCTISYVAYIQHMRGRHISRKKGQRSRSHRSFHVLAQSALTLCMWHTYNTWGEDVSRIIFRIKGQRSRLYRPFKVFILSALWLPPHLTKSLHMRHTYNIGGDVSRTIFRTKVQRSSRSHGSVQVLALSAPWLLPYLTQSLHMWHTYNTWGANVLHTIFRIKDQRPRWHRPFEAITLSALWLPPYCLVKQSLGLTHWGRGKIATISQMTFPNAFSLMKMEQFHLTFSLKFVLKVQTKSQEGIQSFTDNYSLSEPMMVSLPTHICVTWPQWVKKMKPLYNSGLIQLHLP